MPRTQRVQKIAQVVRNGSHRLDLTVLTVLGMERYGTVWGGMGRYGAVWGGMGRYGAVWGGMGAVWGRYGEACGGMGTVWGRYGGGVGAVWGDSGIPLALGVLDKLTRKSTRCGSERSSFVCKSKLSYVSSLEPYITYGIHCTTVQEEKHVLCRHVPQKSCYKQTQIFFMS